jgi:hypothetical protein
MRLQTDDAVKPGSAVQHTGRFHVALLHPLDTAGMRGQDNLTIVGRAARWFLSFLCYRMDLPEAERLSGHASPTP